MTEIQQNRWDQLVRRAANVVGGGSQVNDTLNELFPTIDVERVPGELLALMGTRIAWGRADILAGGGVRPQTQLFNPVGSGTMIVITDVTVSSFAPMLYSWATSVAPMTTLIARGQLRDTRLLGVATNSSVAEIRVQATAVPVGGSQEIITLASSPFRMFDENTVVVLSPGFGLSVEGTTDAQRIITNFSWRERTMEASEVSPGG